MALIPQVVDAVDTPIVAAGGIGDERGVVAALALGAEGAQLGTLFLATHESGASEVHKAELVSDNARDTALTRVFSGRLARGIRNRYQLKIIEGRQKEGQKVGDVVRSSQQTRYPPQLDNPLRFKGKVYVLISPRTYSSAVLFSTVVQDCGFGTLAGIGGGARSTQSGGTQNITLPHTQMTMVVPRFVLARSSGGEGLLQPDVMVVDDPFRPMTAVESLMRHARGQ